MAWRDLADFYNPTLPLPIGGKTYEIQSPSAATGQAFQDIADLMVAASEGKTLSETQLARLKLTDDEERDFYASLLGDTYAEMVADGLQWLWIKHASLTIFYWLTISEDYAERWWTSVDPKALGPAKAPQDHKPKTARKTTQPAKRASAAGRKPPTRATKPTASTGEDSSGTESS